MVDSWGHRFSTGNIEEKTYGNSRASIKQGATHNSICSWKNVTGGGGGGGGFKSKVVHDVLSLSIKKTKKIVCI